MEAGKAILSICLFSLLIFTLSACKKEGRVYFKNVKENDTLYSPFNVEMGVEGMDVITAGKPEEGQGHHHILINKDPIAEGVVIPNDKDHLHFGGGQTEATLQLAPGNYRLTLQFADGLHRSYGQKWATTINVTVK